MFDSNFIHRLRGSSSARRAGWLARWSVMTVVLGLLLFERSVHAADWSCGFEASEGFVSTQSASGPIVSVLGGTAVVTSGDAAEGQQFIRFTPQLQDNALVLTLDNDDSAVRERLIRFAFRLMGDPEKTRLVLSCGQTVALRPIAGAVEVEVGDKPPQRFTIPTPSGAWLRVTIDERASEQTWDLSVGETAVARGLAMQSSSTLPSNLLIFADGSLDLDAIHVTVTDDVGTPGAGKSTAAPDPGPGRGNVTNGAGQPSPDPGSPARRDEAVSRSLGYAKTGELASAESVVTISSAERPDTVAWHLDTAAMLSTVAYALHDAGQYASSIALGGEVLRHLQQADQKFSGTEPKVTPAASAFMAARIYDHIMNDPAQAQLQYQRVLTIDANHSGAKEGSDSMARKLKQPAGQRSGATHGG